VLAGPERGYRTQLGRLEGDGSLGGSRQLEGFGWLEGSGEAGRGSSSSRALSTGAGKSRSGVSTSKGTGERARSRASQFKSDHDKGSAGKRLAKAETGGKPMGRPPEEEPDVFVDVPNVHVGKLEIDVERLQAHLALRAQVANLVALVVGVHVDVDKVKIDIEDVDAAALLKVRLHNTYNILDRTLTTIDEHPEILLGVVDTVGTAVEQVGEIGTEATKPGGALSELTSGVGDTVGKLGDGLADTLTSVTAKVNPKRLLERSGPVRKESKAGSRTKQRSRDGKLAKAAGRIAVGGAAGLVGSALYRASRRPQLLGVPVGRKRDLERIAKQAAKSAMHATR
jgi:hypothetical protein